MESKYLPIGTICSLKNNNKKVMIVSYFSIEYHGMIKMYDYKGCIYPEGLLLESQLISFNHDDIANIDYIGFKNEQYDALNAALNKPKDENAKYEQKNIMTNFKFDENGVVIFDGTVSMDNSSNDKSESITIPNPFVLNSTLKNVPETKKDNSIFKFDKNGTVISDGTEEMRVVNTSKYRFDENGFVISDGTEEIEASPSNYQFDKNGTVISDGTEKVEASPSKYQFDENGTVISDGTEKVGTSPSKYQFDENGTVISDGTEKVEVSPSKYQFDENGTVISDGTEKVEASPSKYRFDKNGTVISDGTEEIETNTSKYHFDKNGVVISE